MNEYCFVKKLPCMQCNELKMIFFIRIDKIRDNYYFNKLVFFQNYTFPF